MSYKQRMRDHLRKAEERNLLVDAIEARVLKLVRRHYATVLEKSARPEHVEVYYMKKELDGDLVYTQHANVRNYHINMANMYGLAALVLGDDPE